MNNSLKFLLTDVLDDATISASSTTSGLPASNAQDVLVRKVYRSTASTNEWLKFDVGAATTINCLMIANHNLTLGSVVKFQGHASDSWASPSLDTNLTVATDAQGNNVMKIAHFYATNQEYRWFRLYMEPGTGNASPVDIGRVMAGRYIEPKRNLRDGFTLTTIDPSRGKNTVGRQAYWTTRRQYEELTYALTDINEDQADELLGIYGEVGKHSPLVVALDPVDRTSHNTFYCQFMTDVSRQQRLLHQYGIQDIVFQEKN